MKTADAEVGGIHAADGGPQLNRHLRSALPQPHRVGPAEAPQLGPLPQAWRTLRAGLRLRQDPSQARGGEASE